MNLASCSASVCFLMDRVSDTKNAVREKNLGVFKDLKLEWGKYEIASLI